MIETTKMAAINTQMINIAELDDLTKHKAIQFGQFLRLFDAEQTEFTKIRTFSPCSVTPAELALQHSWMHLT